MSCDCEILLNAARVTTACECPAAGFCKRHNITKVPVWHALCQTRADYLALWDSGKGPGKHAPARFTFGLGDLATWILHVVSFGHTKQLARLSVRFDQLIDRLTFGRIKANADDSCKCIFRKALLNRIRLWPLWGAK